MLLHYKLDKKFNWTFKEKQIFVIFKDCQDMLQNVHKIISRSFSVIGDNLEFSIGDWQTLKLVLGYNHFFKKACSSFNTTTVREEHPRSHHEGTTNANTSSGKGRVQTGYWLHPVNSSYTSLPTSTRHPLDSPILNNNLIASLFETDFE